MVVLGTKLDTFTNLVRTSEYTKLYSICTTLDTTGRQIFPGPLGGGYAESFPWGRGQKKVEATFTSLLEGEY
jgi:hypothetical protein